MLDDPKRTLFRHMERTRGISRYFLYDESFWIHIYAVSDLSVLLTEHSNHMDDLS